ncbi:MAG: dTDP-glucose 4,6-dehydratase [Anaerolineales bacterium]
MTSIKKILVTGGAGFIGSNFIRHLLRVNQTAIIVNLDALTYAGNIENLRNLPDTSRHLFVKGNICDSALLTRLLVEHEIDTVVHFAAETHVDRSILEPDTFIQTNVVGTFTLLEAVRKIWGKHTEGKRFHHISTDEVYGSLDSNSLASFETTAYQPRSPYSATKASSDHLVRSYFHTYNLPVTITNCSNNYGPYQFPEKLIPLIIFMALQNKPLPVYGDGKHIRDWLYVEDHCEAIQLVIEKGKNGETYNVGSHSSLQNIDLVKKICSILDLIRPANKPYSTLITYVPDRQGHDRRYALDSSKIRTELGWLPKKELDLGLLETIKWYLDNIDWVEAVLSQDNFSKWLNINYLKRDLR